MRNSIRQLFRTKVKSCLFFVLITLCALLICLGSNLVIQCQKNMENFKKVFTTIGTVEQRPVKFVHQSMYNSATDSYTYYTKKEYGKVFDMSALDDLGGVTYLSGPERRAFYSVYLPDYEIKDERAGYNNSIIVEASPVKDGIPCDTFVMKLKKVLFAIYQLNVDTFAYCDHFNDKPQMMYADQTYMMSIFDSVPHNYYNDGHLDVPFEYNPGGSPYSSQTDAQGNLKENVLPDLSVEEMNMDFFEKGHYNYWDAYASEKRMLLHTVPVTATDNLNLMMPFYNNDINVTDGEGISEEDFAQGNSVCLIPFNFAKWNDIKVGDKITLPLRVADYGLPAVFNLEKCPLKANGKNFEAFFTGEYTIKGFYRQMPGGGTDEGYSLQENEIIIPKKSIRKSDAENIGNFGDHISPYNTSFQIPNGTIDEFMDAWEARGIDDVDIHFYDKGYSKLEAGILQMERMAVFLLAAGIVMTILVLVFFSSMMIGGQKKRTAIERSLGLSKANCLNSLLSGILLIAVAGCIIGCLSGAFLTREAASRMTEQQLFSREYSSGMIASANDTEDEVQTEQELDGDIAITILAFVFVFGFTVIISGTSAVRNLQEEPLALLSGKDK